MGRRQGREYCWAGLCCLTKRSNKIIIKIKININTHINKESKQNVELDQKTRPKKEKSRKKM